MRTRGCREGRPRTGVRSKGSAAEVQRDAGAVSSAGATIAGVVVHAVEAPGALAVVGAGLAKAVQAMGLPSVGQAVGVGRTAAPALEHAAADGVWGPAVGRRVAALHHGRLNAAVGRAAAVAVGVAGVRALHAGQAVVRAASAHDAGLGVGAASAEAAAAIDAAGLAGAVRGAALPSGRAGLSPRAHPAGAAAAVVAADLAAAAGRAGALTVGAASGAARAGPAGTSAAVVAALLAGALRRADRAGRAREARRALALVVDAAAVLAAEHRVALGVSAFAAG